MSRLKKVAMSDTEKLYKLFCESIAEEITENTKDYESYLSDFVNDTIKAIKTEEFLSDFEKITRDYFIEKNIELDRDILYNDINEFLKLL